MLKCALHTYYLANDMQFHVFSIIFILLLLYNTLIGMIAIFTAIVVFFILSSILIYSYDLQPGYVHTGRRYVITIITISYIYYNWCHLHVVNTISSCPIMCFIGSHGHMSLYSLLDCYLVISCLRKKATNSQK